MEITHHTLSTSHIMMLSCRVSGTILLAARVLLTSLTKPLWCQAVTHTSTGCLSSCSNGQALTPFHVNEDSPVTDKK